MTIDWSRYEDLDPMGEWGTDDTAYQSVAHGKEYISEQEWLETFAANLESLMIEHGYTQSSLAEAINSDQSTISRYLRAERMPSVKNLVNIMIVLDGRLEDILDFGAKVF